MATTTDLSVLKINYLTQAQYSTAVTNNTINPNELYLTPSATLTVGEGGTGNTSFTANKLIYAETTSKLSSSSGLSYFTGNSTASSPATYTRLHINGATYGNTAANMISGTAGLFSFGDGGPQITFDTSATPGGGQAGALIFTDHDNAATGASWHFVSNQTDWNVTSKRFHARTSISIGTNLPNTSYNLYVNGSTMHNGDIYQSSLSGQRWREHFYEATAGTSALGTGTQTFTVKGGRWGEIWFEYPRLTTTYATAGDASSTATTSTVAGRYWWRQWSYNSSTADRLSYYENFYLPTVSADRTANASYEIFTSKSYTTLDGRYVNVSGDTMTGQLNRTADSLGGSWIQSRDNAIISVDASSSTSSTAFSLARVKFSTKTYAIGSERAGNNFGIYGWLNSRTENGTDWSFYIGNDTYFHCSTRLYGAVWNDYAEYRQTKEDIQPGKVVIETGNGDLKLSDRRLQPGANVTTDTFGFAIGKTEINKTPIAVSGRVLVYPYESIDEFRKHIGSPVCSGPDGTVSIMSINEERLYPSRIIGTVSEIPNYEEWGTENIKVNGRIWIRIR